MKENIHIAILGPVSAGKSTFLNALLGNTYSDMMRKKTTMLPQIYQTTKDIDKIDHVNFIKKKNLNSNETILKLRESGQYNSTHFKELNYKVKEIDNFIDLPLDSTYSICDMPGLNCSGGGDIMYYNYLELNSHKIDIYILVFDINSALNTTDEVKILEKVSEYIKKNNHGYVYILVNKSDYVEFESCSREEYIKFKESSDDSVETKSDIKYYKFKFSDDELSDLYNRIKVTVKKYIDKFYISPICSSDLYIYRTALHNIDSLENAQLDDIIKKESGKKEFLKLQKESINVKQAYVIGMVNEYKDELENSWMKDTGYTLFLNNMNEILNNYSKIILHHIDLDIDNLLINIENNGISFDYVSTEIEKINLRIKNLKNISDTDIINIRKKITKICDLLNSYLKTGIDTYSASTIEIADSFLLKIYNFMDKIKHIFNSNHNMLESSENIIKNKRIELLNNSLGTFFNVDIFTELYKLDKINMIKYIDSIKYSLHYNNEKYFTFKYLLLNVENITKGECCDRGNEKYILPIINHVVDNWRSSSEFDLSEKENFNLVLELISYYTNNSKDIMLRFIISEVENIKIYKYWFDLNSSSILTKSYEVKYFMYKIKYIDDNELKEDFHTFRSDFIKLDKMYINIEKFFNNTDIIKIDSDKSDNSDRSDKSYKYKNKQKIDSNDEEKNKTIYRNSMENTKILTLNRIERGKGKIDYDNSDRSDKSDKSDKSDYKNKQKIGSKDKEKK